MVVVLLTTMVLPVACTGIAKGSIADHIVISEVQIKGDSDTKHDFVELYNPTEHNINLNDYEGSYIRLVKRTASGDSDIPLKSWSQDEMAIVPARGYYLWASSSDEEFPDSIGADAQTGETIAQNNAVALRKGDTDIGAIIDAVGWGTATNALVEGSAYPTNPVNNQSIQRRVNDTIKEDGTHGPAWDSENNSLDFFIHSSDPNNIGSNQIPPLPEFSTVVMLSSGLLSLLAYARRANQKNKKN
ncbi:MAG: lamin tail domain-containing protein [Halobacteriota archaeon]|nr:lamin tail domain-containing protein [Halobacteriota archaeon]